MPWCPRCQTEYRPGFTRCADCGAPLEAQAPAPAPLRSITPVLLTEAVDDTTCRLLCSLLDEHGIPVERRAHDPLDDIRRLYTGRALFGTDLYVADADLEAARALTESYLSPHPLPSALADEIAAMPYPEEPIPSADRPRAAKALLLTGLFVLAMLGLWYLSKL